MFLDKKSLYDNLLLRDVLLRTNGNSIMNSLKIRNVDISISDPSIALNKKGLLPILTALELITKQKPILIKSKRLNAQYNIRRGALVGAKVTLRGDSMFSFLEILILLVFPRFSIDSYLTSRNINEKGNISFKIKEPMFFPQLENEMHKFSRIPDINITISTTANTKKEGLSLLSYLNFPFR